MTQEELLRQQQEKLAGIQQQQQAQQVPPQSFAEGKQAANSQTGAVSAQPAAVPVTPQPANYNLFARDKATNYPHGAQGTPQTTLISQPTNTETQPAGQTTQVITVPGKSKDNTTKPIASTEDLAAALGYTSPEDEERMRRASIANRRILAVGDALRHIGNIANTVNYAPAQQLNMPVLEEQARYEKGKAIRDAANYKYYTYQQAKAAQDAKAKQWEADYNIKLADAARKAGYTEAQIKAMQDNLALKKTYNEGVLAAKNRQIDANIAHQKETEKQGRQRIGLGWANHKLSREKFNYLKSKVTGGSVSGSSPYDFATPNGKITMGKNFTQAQKDQVVANFPQYTNQSEIKRQMMALGMNTNDPAQVRNYQFAQMLLEHQDVADFVTQKFGGKQTFDSNPLSRPSSTQQPMFQTPWGGGAFAGENPYDQYLLSDEDDSDNTDYEQYLIQ